MKRRETICNGNEGVKYTRLFRRKFVAFTTLFGFTMGSTPHLAVHIRLFSVSSNPFVCIFRNTLDHLRFTLWLMSDTELGPNDTESARMLAPPWFPPFLLYGGFIKWDRSATETKRKWFGPNTSHMCHGYGAEHLFARKWHDINGCQEQPNPRNGNELKHFCVPDTVYCGETEMKKSETEIKQSARPIETEKKHNRRVNHSSHGGYLSETVMTRKRSERDTEVRHKGLSTLYRGVLGSLSQTHIG